MMTVSGSKSYRRVTYNYGQFVQVCVKVAPFYLKCVDVGQLDSCLQKLDQVFHFFDCEPSSSSHLFNLCAHLFSAIHLLFSFENSTARVFGNSAISSIRLASLSFCL